MAKRLIPLLDRVLVEKLKPVNKSIGGILLPDTATHKVRISLALHKISSFLSDFDRSAFDCLNVAIVH